MSCWHWAMKVNMCCYYARWPDVLPQPTRPPTVNVLCKKKRGLSLLPLCSTSIWMLDDGALIDWDNGHSHIVLDEPLDFVAGVYVLAVFDGAVFELVAESWWAEQDDSPVNQHRKCHCSLAAAPTAATLRLSNVWGRTLFWLFFFCKYLLPRTQGRNNDWIKGYLLSVNAVALEESLRVGVGEAVVVPQGAGCLQELDLCCALVISKEPWEGKMNHVQIRIRALN